MRRAPWPSSAPCSPHAWRLPPPTAAAARPTCFGHKATIVGNNRGNHIKGTHHGDVIAGLGGRDVITSNGGRDIICGGVRQRPHPRRQAERLKHDKPTTLIGGPGNDHIEGSFASDFIVADNANLSGDAIGHVGRDTINGDSETTSSSATTTPSSTPREASTT